MKLPWRKRDSTVAAADPATPVEPVLPSLEQLRTEIESVSGRNRQRRDPALERQVLRARHLAGMRLMDDAPAAPQFPSGGDDDLPAGDPLPEFRMADLTPSRLRAAILRDGCALVRGLVPRDAALELAQGIDDAYARREAAEAGQPAGDGLYDEFVPHDRFGGVLWRSWIKEGGGLLGADSPALFFRFTELLHEQGFDRLVAGYLGEPALLSVHKTTLRKAEPTVSGAWHQDGRFMGPVRALNLWLSLSDCGEDAPGLDIVPRRLEDYLATGTEDAALDWTISESQAQAAAGTGTVIRPVFAPGDALLFDEVFLHKTGSEPTMPNPRYAVESWFFGGSAFPADYAPIAV